MLLNQSIWSFQAPDFGGDEKAPDRIWAALQRPIPPQRQGHFFQNPYKSILGEEDPYLREPLQYIHLNPVRSGLVKDLKGLWCYLYSGHWVVMGKKKRATTLFPYGTSSLKS